MWRDQAKKGSPHLFFYAVIYELVLSTSSSLYPMSVHGPCFGMKSPSRVRASAQLRFQPPSHFYRSKLDYRRDTPRDPPRNPPARSSQGFAINSGILAENSRK